MEFKNVLQACIGQPNYWSNVELTLEQRGDIWVLSETISGNVIGWTDTITEILIKYDLVLEGRKTY